MSKWTGPDRDHDSWEPRANEHEPMNYQVIYQYPRETRPGFVYADKEAADEEVMKAQDAGTSHHVIETDAPPNIDQVYEDREAGN